MIRRLFLALFTSVALNASAWALGGYDSLSGDSKKLTDALIERLDVSKNDGFRLYEAYLKDQINAESWSVNHYGNSSISGNKVERSATRTMFINFVTDNRYVNLTFVKFMAERQILVQSLETLPRGVDVAMQKHNELKKDKDWSNEYSDAKYEVYGKKGQTDKVKVLVNSGIGGIQYVTFYAFDLK